MSCWSRKCTTSKYWYTKRHFTLCCISSRWRGDFKTLELNHGFIQWLFPIREHGVNIYSQPLQLREIQSMTLDPEILDRLKVSYSIMLEFYGMEIQNFETGLLRRSDSYRSRYRHLSGKQRLDILKNQHSMRILGSGHNYLRISRILKCLSELGLERLNAGLLLHILNEQSENGYLITSRLRSSMDRWWINCVRNDQERRWLNVLVTKVRNEEFVFDRKTYELALENRKRLGVLSLPGIDDCPS